MKQGSPDYEALSLDPSSEMWELLGKQDVNDVITQDGCWLIGNIIVVRTQHSQE